MNNNKTKKNENIALNELMSAASKQLGCTPSELSRKLKSGELEQSIRSSSDPNMAAIKKVLNDPKAMNSFLNDPRTAELMQKLKRK